MIVPTLCYFTDRGSRSTIFIVKINPDLFFYSFLRLPLLYGEKGVGYHVDKMLLLIYPRKPVILYDSVQPDDGKDYKY